ncbi:MAG: hypothetical protein H0V11_07745 [Actinobacteria bacterium]|nr:hypothetical protein [Actinomycetota bacterium]
MPRIAWIVLSAAAALLFLGFAGAAFVIASGSGSEAAEVETTLTLGERSAQLELPLADDEEAVMLAKRRGRVLVGLAARPGGPVEVAALAGEKPVASKDLSLAVDGRSVEAVPCGRACSRLDVDAFKGARRLTVNAPDTFEFLLPEALPPSGAALFAQVQREMRSLRVHRYTEELTSGVGAGVSSTFDVRAPNRLAFRTADGFRSIIIGKNRWDFRNERWERSAFPGLRVPTYMWDGARNARLLGKTRLRGRQVQIVSVYDRDPIPAWLRLFVDPQNRVLDARMIAPSHFMRQQFSQFNGPIEIRPPK